MSAFLTKEMAHNAVWLIEASMTRALEGEGSVPRLTKRNVGHLRVSALVNGVWESLVIRNFGDKSSWEHLYDAHATSKERISQRTGLSTREVQTIRRNLLESGDTIYFGSVTNGTIVVAYSGVEAYFDEMFAKWVLAACEALLEHELERQKAAGAEDYQVVY